MTRYTNGRNNFEWKERPLDGGRFRYVCLSDSKENVHCFCLVNSIFSRLYAKSEGEHDRFGIDERQNFGISAQGKETSA